ncbi:aldo/keto reductase [Halalkalicoccus jeotgali]|uniref:Aldo/keto reductase n=1 Tax=Halalkalicoccus jeotgali (strain DSM 18796 / CECT 7217 / JCM 14584 / KCTC 4019 / B3) TaxID=795797 RepID=D8J704_HALJB|nr:aldo/keto reductase [Halalkalicoccus jeotgali]ADJ15957.1 aldo/keto reductase [Halalkalicoccus jeotgali B3]ELY38053.1 aldo/keto reductase [Halalkalicoccus jeotgali B3]
MDLELPPIGLGTMGIDEPETIASAIEMGYRHLDTAQIYENEAVVGEGISRADVPREELTVATKVWADSLAPADVRESTEASLDRLGLDAVDLLYVHRPIEAYDPETTLPAFDSLREDGLIERIGMSNFTTTQLGEAREILDAPIAAHQVERHPFYREDDLLEYAREDGHTLVAYAPLAQGNVFDDPILGEIAAERGVSEAQVSLAWLAGTAGVVSIPKASSEEHLKANLAAAEIELTSEERARIDGVEGEGKLFE